MTKIRSDNYHFRSKHDSPLQVLLLYRFVMLNIIKMAEITTIKEMLEELANGKRSPMKVLEVMKSTHIPTSEFEKYYSWDDDQYTRNVLMRNKELEVLLICWEKGQSSPIHDFNSQEAWIHPIVGQLREERYKINPGDDIRLERVSSVLLGTDEYTYMNQVGIHRYSNAYEARSVSLNIYSKPVTEWRIYEEETSNSTLKKPWENKSYELV